jgi:hypothetical protein
MKILIVLIFIYYIFFFCFYIVCSNKSGQISKFERLYRDCNNNQCMYKPNDETCVFICMNRECFNKVYGNYMLEYGEINYEMKKEFENCFNLKIKNK